jgi:hypothetical protein
MVIRKQLSNVQEKYKRMGVVGALAMLRTLGHRDGTADEDDQGPLLSRLSHVHAMVLCAPDDWMSSAVGAGSSSQAAAAPTAAVKQATAILTMIVTNCRKMPVRPAVGG